MATTLPVSTTQIRPYEIWMQEPQVCTYSSARILCAEFLWILTKLVQLVLQMNAEINLTSLKNVFTSEYFSMWSLTTQQSANSQYR